MLSYLNYPSWLQPEIIPGFFVRWYGLMYLAAFAVTYFLFKQQVKQKKMEISDEEVSNYFFWGILGLMLGARLFAVFIYSDDRLFYLTHPWRIFWPFMNGQFVGLQGMSYHGGLVGGATGLILYCRKHKRSVWEWGDMIAMGAPLGYTFGRLANFINGELYGRVSTRPWAMIFPHAERFSTAQDWVKEVAAKIGMNISSMTMVNLPRHPSQLYEALFEGLLLWLLLWFLLRKRDHHRGAVVSFYLIGYGFFRFIIEYFREPDENLGHIFSWGKAAEDIYLFRSVFNFSMGQLLCFLMIAAGILIFFLTKKWQNINQQNIEPPPKKVQEKKDMRKLRKKIK
ncbi:MAG: prolipoprotein diacylglyceryl transferase [Spirochaetaceae bacterium]|jgi:phosphatidylglycerol:prolipoprotein diacylglycerol transferase|nr:prolipoprotein diacylglyceryl transferase [Spirochaetaceae bacterium]